MFDLRLLYRAAPALFFAIALRAQTTATLTWPASPGATSYTVSRSLDGITYNPLASVSGTSYTDSNSASTDLYTVAAIVPTSQAVSPLNVSFSTPPPPPPPAGSPDCIITWNGAPGAQITAALAKAGTFGTPCAGSWSIYSPSLNTLSASADLPLAIPVLCCGTFSGTGATGMGLLRDLSSSAVTQTVLTVSHAVTQMNIAACLDYANTNGISINDDSFQIGSSVQWGYVNLRQISSGQQSHVSVEMPGGVSPTGLIAIPLYHHIWAELHYEAKNANNTDASWAKIYDGGLSSNLTPDHSGTDFCVSNRTLLATYTGRSNGGLGDMIIFGGWKGGAYPGVIDRYGVTLVGVSGQTLTQ